MSLNKKFLVLFSLCLSFSLLVASIPLFNPVFVRASPDAGDTWTAPLNVSVIESDTTAPYSDRAIAVDCWGNIHMVIEGESDDGFNGREIYYITNSTGTWTWENVSQTPDNLYADQYRPVLAIDSNNVVHVVWFGFFYSGSNIEIFYANNSGGVWSPPLNISKSMRYEYEPSLFIDRDDTLHIAYVTVGLEQICYVNRTNDGQWSTPLAVASYSFSPYDPGISIVVDSLKEVYIAYTSNDPTFNHDVFVVNTTNGIWGAPYNVSRDMATDDFSDLQVTMDIDSYDNLHLAWIKVNISSYVMYVNCTQGVWGDITTVFGTGPTQPSLITDLAGKVHVTFNYYAVSLSIFYTNNTQGYFGTPTMVDNSSRAVDDFSHITLDCKGYAHILYLNSSADICAFYRRSIEPVAPPLTPPQISGPTNMGFQWGDPDPQLTWRVTSPWVDGGCYKLYRDGVEIRNGTWTNDTNLQLNVTGLNTLKTYNITLWAGHNCVSSTDQFDIMVYPPSPTISSPADLDYTLGEADPQITWQVTSAYYTTGPYELYLNGSVIDTGTWTNHTDLTLNITDLTELGIANVTLLAEDTYGNTVSDRVDITVSQQTQPTGDLTLPLIIGGVVGAVAVIGIAFYMLKIRKP